jgi:catechol 2,3-dioxygenase-like lactoylglutathione lyase family enzyme
MKKLMLSLALAAIALVAVTHVAAQSASPTKAFSHAIHAVDDLDTTLAFYRNVFGLNGNPSDFPNPAVPLLTNAPGVTLRLSMLALPGGMRFELTHFKGLERKPAQAKYTDPGAASIVFYVRDIDGALANAKKTNPAIVTTGGTRRDLYSKRQSPFSRVSRSGWLLHSADPGNSGRGCT